MAEITPTLDELLAYHNERVVHYYCHHHPPVNIDEAHLLFKDLMAWLWIKAYRRISKRTSFLFGPLLDIDAMWHAFILHTRDYHAFCQQYFGTFIHHDIEPPGNEYQITPDELADFLNDCFEHLGEKWVLRYFSGFLETTKD